MSDPENGNVIATKMALSVLNSKLQQDTAKRRKHQRITFTVYLETINNLDDTLRDRMRKLDFGIRSKQTHS
jgi:hypothetical protein